MERRSNFWSHQFTIKSRIIFIPALLSFRHQIKSNENISLTPALKHHLEQENCEPHLHMAELEVHDLRESAKRKRKKSSTGKKKIHCPQSR